MNEHPWCLIHSSRWWKVSYRGIKIRVEDRRTGHAVTLRYDTLRLIVRRLDDRLVATAEAKEGR